MKLSPWIVLIGCLLLSSCDMFRNDNDLAPYYLNIESMDLEVDITEGSDTHGIRDAWIIANGQDVGVFELPITVPILDDASTTEFTIFAGIRQNGTKSFAIEYPFYTPIRFEIDGVSGETYSKNLIHEYTDDTFFEIVDNFDNATFFTTVVDDFDDSFFELREDEDISNNVAGVLYANKDNPICEMASSLRIPTSDVVGKKPYLEIDYKGNAPLQIGVRGLVGNIIESKYGIILKPSEDWNKLYLSLTDIVNTSSFSEFSILLGVDIRGFAENEAEAWVDNVKLVRFQ